MARHVFRALGVGFVVAAAVLSGGPIRAVDHDQCYNDFRACRVAAVGWYNKCKKTCEGLPYSCIQYCFDQYQENLDTCGYEYDVCEGIE